MTIEQIKAATGATEANVQLFAPSLNQACEQYEINTPTRQLCFLAQVGHESGGLFYTEELASGEAYEGRKDLGNTQSGDGVRFKGRGLIQITGRANYVAVGKALGINLIIDPSLLGGKNVTRCTPGQLTYAALSAAWFWNGRKLNDLADKIDISKPIDEGQNLEQFKAITKKINGGYNGLDDRLHRYRTGLGLFATA